MSYVSQLQKLGFTAKEACVYLACLKTGPARSAAIAEEAALPKSTTLDLLFVLNKRGMVARTKQKNRYVFTATDPSAIEAWLERRVSLFRTLQPKLEALELGGKRTGGAHVFDDTRSMPTVWQQVIAHTHEVFMLVSTTGDDAGLTHTLEHFAKLRAKHKVPARILLSNRTSDEISPTIATLAEVRTAKHPLPPGVLVAWNSGHVSISPTPIRAVLVDDPCAAAQVLALVQEAWSGAS